MTTPIYTVRDPEFSRWQSTVEQYLKNKNPDLSIGKIRQLPMMQGCWQHVKSAFEKKTIAKPKKESVTADSIEFNAYASQFFFKLRKTLPNTTTTTTETVMAKASVDDDWDYSTGDTLGWAECVYFYYNWYGLKSLKYRDYVEDGGGSLNYSVIDWKIPSNGGKVLIVGDWGTSNEDAEKMLYRLVYDHQPHCIIHLGDIYYSGTDNECTDNFYNVIRSQVGSTIPVFTIPGNHEYYSYGDGFYNLIDKMNHNLSNAQQEASYFCLKTDDGKWQFLGLDTGYNDHSPWDTNFNPPAPDLRSQNDVTWAKDKIDHFSGQTIMLSHHQLFTHSGSMCSDDYGDDSSANPFLYKYFASNFKDKIAAWFWGHEHSFALYQDGIFGLNKGRLLGASSYEESVDDDPYVDNFPMVPYAPNNVKLGTNTYPTSHDSNKYYPHVGAIMTFNGNANPSIDYYSFPSWEDGAAPASSYQVLTRIANETITPATPKPTGIWSGNHKVKNGNGTTDKAPGLAHLNHSMYMVYKNTNDNDHIWWDNPSYSNSSGKFTASNPQVITPSRYSTNTDDDIPATASNPSIIPFNGLIYLVYRGSGKTNIRWCTLDPSNGEWTKYGKVSDFVSGNPDVKSNHGPKLAVFNNQLHLIYLSTSDDKTVYLSTSNANSTTWSTPTRIQVQGSSSYVQSANNICPAIAANSNDMYLVYCLDSSSDKMGLLSCDLNGVWRDLGTINNGSNAANVPTSTKGMSICVDSHFVRMLYTAHGGDHYINWANYDITNRLWSGGLPIVSVSNGDKMQTQSFPAFCLGLNYAYMAFAGNSTENIWTGVQENT